ncbi:MAG: ATP-dependent RecD-like DNA helicase [Clostridiales bacterium]|nr:ATP-dependent RecD-like DNA helicase [Clostridiales bacterium]MDR2750213.1 ATP-dependent RecD-like DNA helicase [Clostridiales bacterium]
MNESICLEGTIERVIFRKETFSVFYLDRGDARLTCKGKSQQEVRPGDRVWVTGKYTSNSELAIESLRKESLALEAYLSQAAGMDRVLSRAVADRFGDEALLVLAETPDRLVGIAGITQPMAARFCESLLRCEDDVQTVLKLMEYSPDLAFCRRIAKAYGTNILNSVKANPFKLVDELKIGFEAADAIGKKANRESELYFTNPRRQKFGIKQILEDEALRGNACVPQRELAMSAWELLQVPENAVDKTLCTLEAEKVVKMDLVGNEKCVYLGELYKTEASVAEMVAKLKGETFEASGIAIIIGSDKERAKCIKRMLESTTSIDARIAAPTSLLAQRLSDLTGAKTETYFELMQEERPIGGEQSARMRGEANPLEGGLVVLDKCESMDLETFHGVLRALPSGAKLVLSGDLSRIPGEGPGRVFESLVESKLVPVMRLEDNPDCPAKIESYLIGATGPGIVDNVISLAKDRLPNYKFSGPMDIQVLAPARKGPCGSESLNKALQDAINPPKAGKGEICCGSGFFREGDKVVQTSNNWSAKWQSGFGVSKGEVGIIVSIDANAVTVEFGNKEVEYPLRSLCEIELAYAMTVQMSMGRQYRAVILAMPETDEPALGKELLIETQCCASETLAFVGNKTRFRELDKRSSKFACRSALADRLKAADARLKKRMAYV